MKAIQHWYDRGIRMFEFDMADFDAALPDTRKSLPAHEIRDRNIRAFKNALREFRSKNPDAMLVAFNGFGGDHSSTSAPFPFKDPVDLGWLEVFDTLYSGDTRASDVPQASFWRSVDLYNDHMARRYEQSGVPLERIDPFFTLSTTWFGYMRGKRAWKGMLLLTLARGSWKKTIYGDLSLLNGADAAWFSRAQRMYAPLSAMGRTKSFGGIPGETQPYGFGSFDSSGALYTVVNPMQRICEMQIPLLSAAQTPPDRLRVLFRDAGYVPTLRGTSVTIGPGQMVLIGTGKFADESWDLGIQEDVIIPRAIENLDAAFLVAGPNTVEATLIPPAKRALRVILQLQSSVRQLFPRGEITARQGTKQLPITNELGSIETIYTPVPWELAEISSDAIIANEPIIVRYVARSDKPLQISGSAYAVDY
jgi:hypothetical protein